jgi:tetratricopeptide (TPR) repeat protein
LDNPPTVFLSYAHSDAEWTRKLADDLKRDGFGVFLDERDIAIGDELVKHIDQGLARASSGLIIYGRRTGESRWVAAEYAALAQRSIQHELRLAAVLLADVDLPPILSTRIAADFRSCRSEQDYRDRLDRLERALRGEPPMRAGPGGIPVPADLTVRWEGPRRVTVRVTGRQVSIRAGEREAALPHEGEPDHRVTERWWVVRRARQDAAVAARSAGPGSGPAPGLGAASQPALLQFGQALGNQFLAGAVGELLESELAEAERKNAALQIALEVAGDSGLQALPWEALCLPGREQPLVLHPRTQLYRFVTGLGGTPDIRIPGPLRILAAIGAPEADGDEALDHEAELDRIVRAVERARREERARVRVLEWGSVPAIRDALREERFHILHISCRASPTALLMETADGHPDPVTAVRLADEILVPDQGVPLVVLAGSSTAFESSGDAGNVGLPSLARGLLTRGVPAVLAMTSEVSDRYAIELASRFYRSLAGRQQSPDCLAAFSDARRELEGERQQLPPDDPQAALAEWWTPALYLRTESRPLFDTSENAAAGWPAEAGLAIGGIAPRRLDDFVGRRADLRVLSQVLRSDEPAAIVYGIGGMGKTSLAIRLMTVLSRETDLVLFIRGRTTPTEILQEMGAQLRALRVKWRLARDHELELAADELKDPRQGWSDQLALVERAVLPEVSTLIVLDEAEQNVAGPDRESPGSVPSALADPELAAFIVSWTALGARARLLITSRHPLDLPEAAGRLTEHHLGPLSRAETDKLMWRLEALGALERPERDRAYADVGGHPRALEYVDSLLRGGRARFRDVAARMEAALRARGIADPSSWLARGAGDLDQALAETITLIVDDVLVDRLLARLQPYPLARQLFVAASVFRVPVDADGLNWAVAESLDPDPDPGRVTRASQAYRQLEQAQHERTGFLLRDLGLPPDLMAQLYRDCAAGGRPSERAGLARAIETLAGMFLLTKAHGYPDDNPRYVVHRWTARGLSNLIQAGLAGLVDATELPRAHGRAAAYYEWRAERYGDAVADLLEARHHRREAGDAERAASLTLRAATILSRWGEFDQIRRLCAETLQEVAEDAEQVTELLHMQSWAAQKSGDYRAAEQLCRDCLAAAHARADRRWIALAHELLARIAADLHGYAQAQDEFRTALDLARDLRDRVLEARCYQGFGAVALALGNLDDAIRYSKAARRNAQKQMWRQHFSLQGLPELAQLARASGDLAAAGRLAIQLAARQEDARDLEQVIGQSWLQIGQLDLRRDDTQEAAHAFQEAAKVAGHSRNRVLLKDCYLQLGRTWQRVGKPGPAREAYFAYITLADQMGDRPGVVDCYHQMGELDLAHGDPDAAAAWHEHALRLASELEQPGLVAQAHLRLGAVQMFRGDAAAAQVAYTRSRDIGRDSGDPQILVASLLGLADVELATGAPDNAEAIYRDCRRVANRVGDQADMARCQLGLGRVDRMRGDYSDAAHDFREARQAAVQLGNPALEAECLRELGATAQDDGRPADAQATYLEALRLADKHGSADMIADLCRRLARLTPGTWARKDWYQRAADRLQQLGQPARSAELCLEMAAHIAPADLAEAESCCHRALGLVDSDEQSAITVLAHVELARCARRGGDYARATSECARAVELAEALGRPVLIAPACQEGGLISQLAGDPGPARELHRRALSQAEDAAVTGIVIAACRDLGRLARRDGHDTGEDSAESWYGRALSLAEAAGDEWTAIACAEQLALSAMRRGAPEDATELSGRWPELCGPFGEQGRDRVMAEYRARLGAEFTDSGRPDEAIGFTTASFLALIEIDARSAGQQAALLQRQRAELGTEAFAALLAEHVTGDLHEELMKMSHPAASGGQD